MENFDEILKNIGKKKMRVPRNIENLVDETLENVDICKDKRKTFCFSYDKKTKILKPCIAMFVVGLMLSTGVYASVEIYKNKIKQKNISRNQDNSDNYYDWINDMTFDDDMYYKKISNYADYKNLKSHWNNIYDATEEEFKNEFLLIIMARTNTYISNVSCDDTKTFVELSTCEGNSDQNENLISTMISKEYEREKIDLIINPNISADNKYKNLEQITDSYSKEEAIADGCFVLENYKIVSNNLFEDFINKTKRNEEDSIRIVIYYDSKYIFIRDIIYKDGEYKMCYYNPKTKETYFVVGDGIEVTQDDNLNYWLVNEESYSKYGVSDNHICEIQK